MCIKDVVELVDLLHELILAIMKKVNPRVLLLCSMIDISNHRLEKLAFGICHYYSHVYQIPNPFVKKYSMRKKDMKIDSIEIMSQ